MSNQLHPSASSLFDHMQSPFSLSEADSAVEFFAYMMNTFITPGTLKVRIDTSMAAGDSTPRIKVSRGFINTEVWSIHTDLDSEEPIIIPKENLSTLERHNITYHTPQLGHVKLMEITTTLHSTRGDYVAIVIRRRQQLNNLCTSVCLPPERLTLPYQAAQDSILPTVFQLSAVISYRGGHCFLVFRQKGLWYLYDDLKVPPVVCKQAESYAELFTHKMISLLSFAAAVYYCTTHSTVSYDDLSNITELRQQQCLLSSYLHVGHVTL